MTEGLGTPWTCVMKVDDAGTEEGRFVTAVAEHGFDETIQRFVDEKSLIGISTIGGRRLMFAFADRGFAVFSEDENKEIEAAFVLPTVNDLHDYCQSEGPGLWEQIVETAPGDGAVVGIRIDRAFDNIEDCGIHYEGSPNAR